MAATSFPANSQDWKGRFIFDMAAALANLKETELALWAPPGELPPGVVSVLSERDKLDMAQLASKGGIAHLLRRSPIRGALWGGRLLRSFRSTCQCTDTDIYHCNWLQTALAIPSDGKPALVTVLGTDFLLLNIPAMPWLLRRVFRRRPTILAPNAAWMVPRLRRLFGDIAAVVEVPFGVDSAWFSVRRDAVCLKEWIAVIRLTRAKLGDLEQWGAGLFGGSSGRRLHLFGPMQESLVLPDWVDWHGATNPRDLRQDWFPRAAGLITLSRHAEGRPQVVLEAMAAGLPVLATDIPAHIDVLQHRETGYLCGTREEFAGGLQALEDSGENLRVGQAARRWVGDSIGDWSSCAQRYASNYHRLLKSELACARS